MEGVLTAYRAYVGMFTSVQQLLAELAYERADLFDFLMQASKSHSVSLSSSLDDLGDGLLGGRPAPDVSCDDGSTDAPCASLGRVRPLSRLNE